MVYRVVFVADSDEPGLNINIRLKTGKPVLFRKAGFSSGMVLMVGHGSNGHK